MNANEFAALGLSPEVAAAAAAAGYSVPTPIQAQAIPHAAGGADVIGTAQTGTGKTAAFGLPLVHRLRAARRAPPPGGARALVLAPTRELAQQIATSLRSYAAGARMSVAEVFGGVGFGKQVADLRRGVDILVACPGRLVDLMEQRQATLARVEVLVLDEADRMLDLGFAPQVRRIVEAVPASRQTMLFSATMPREVEGLAASVTRSPVRVAAAPPSTTVEQVEQFLLFVDSASKPAALAAIAGSPEVERAIVFTRTKHGADRVAEGLARRGVSAAAIHGNKSQGQRERALGAFKSGACKVLVATDIAARGIDVPNVSHVIQYDLADSAEAYVHRIGRTARAGKAGEAIAFCSAEEGAMLRDVKRGLRCEIPVCRDHEWHSAAAEAAWPHAQRPPQGRGRQGPRRPRDDRPEFRRGRAGPSPGGWR
jgi:ATP-dependent RNA helicase RhlE